MENLPVEVLGHILSFLNRIDQYNAAIALNHDFTALSTIFHKRIVLACEYRFKQTMIPSLITCRPDAVTLLDLTGIFWIPSEVILQTCLHLVNLESMYLWGTGVIVDGTKELQEFKGLQKIKYIAVAVINFNGWPKWSINGNAGMGVQYCLLQRKDQSKQKTYGFSKFDTVMRVQLDQIKKDSDELLSIISNKWIFFTNEKKDPKSFCERLKLDCTEISYVDFLDEKKITNIFKKDLQIDKNLYLRKKVEESDFPPKKLNIEPIKCLVNLTLHIDVTDRLAGNFLKPILKSCRNLKKLSIKCFDENFPWKHLTYASENLKDLSVILKHREDFNLNDFLSFIVNAPHLMLQRLYLNYGYVAPSEHYNTKKSKLTQFMSLNPQLTFVCIVSDDPDFHLRGISLQLARFKKNQYQWFQCKRRLTNEQEMYIDIDDIPLQHVDMLNLSLRFNAVPERIDCRINRKSARESRRLVDTMLVPCACCVMDKSEGSRPILNGLDLLSLTLQK